MKKFIIGFCIETVYFKTTSIRKSYNTVSIWVKKIVFDVILHNPHLVKTSI
jgi:hypothetical protein